MQDFKRIGGEILSSPLNENFRKLRNDISIANTNLIFNNDHSVVDTIKEMYAMLDDSTINVVDGQWCYVVSTGELFRYSNIDRDWHKIGDFGRTFRQGFLSTGLVLMEGEMTWNANHTGINIPRMLLYFKTQPGDGNYIMGMYRIDAQVFNIPKDDQGHYTDPSGAYSIFCSSDGTITKSIGLPLEDDINKVYLGSVIISNADGWEDSLYTMPDMAYTADRSYFIFNGGEVQGCTLYGNSGSNTVNNTSGLIYDEGINYPIGDCDDYPLDSGIDNDFSIKQIEAKSQIDCYYIYPDDPTAHDMVHLTGLSGANYFDNGTLKPVPDGKFTIQRYVITQDGYYTFIYGNRLFNSMEDAVTHFNDLLPLNQINFYLQK